MERLFSLTEAGKRIGGVSVSAVRQLIKERRLAAVTQPLRQTTGTRPRMYVASSEIERYCRSLKEASPRYEPVKEKVSRARGVRGELAGMRQYV